MDPLIRLALPLTIPSQNRRDRTHWALVNRFRRDCEWGILAALGQRIQREPKRRRLVITSIRPRRIIDRANLVGGAKSLVDACTSCGLIYDDSDEWVTIEYRQETLQGRRPVTVVEVWDGEGAG